MAKVNQTQNKQETVTYGGVKLAASQIQACKKTMKNGNSVFEVEFKNGVKVQFNDQTNPKIQKQRLQDTGAIFMKENEIYLYNIHGGEITGTPRSEYIELHLCRDFNVDGKGGNDSYYSYQDVQFSHNSYKMHVGDYYQKCGTKAFENINFYKLLSKERDYATFHDYTITDNKKRQVEAEMMEEERLELIKHRDESYKKASTFEVEPLKPEELTTEAKEQIKQRARDGYEQIQYERMRDESYWKQPFVVEPIAPEELTPEQRDAISNQNNKLDIKS